MDILKSHISESEKQLEKRVNRELAEFFETEPVAINVILHDSKDSLDKLWKNADYKNKKQAPDWLVAFATYGTDLHILAPDIMPKGHEKTGYLRFQKILKHEISHLYINDINKSLPSWLEEGICLYVAEQDNYRPIDTGEISVELLHELDNAPTDTRIYSVGKNMVNQIVGNYGKDKLFEIMKIESQVERYAKITKMFDWLK